MNKFVIAGAFIMATTFLTGCAKTETKKFENSEIVYETKLSQVWDMVKAYWNDDRKHATPSKDVPLDTLTKAQLLAESSDAVFKLGHSTVLLRLDGEFVLIDPVFSERAFPVQWMGPKRFHPTPIDITELPDIAAVVISHDHYDHLDKHAIKQLKEKVKTFITPLKVGDHLRDWGIEDNQIVELNWWQSTKVNNLEFVATPAQHFSGRSLTDKDHTLWASWVIRGWESNIFYSGDTGYFDGFKQIGEKYGPFDVTLIETGAYNELWTEIHMMPEQSLQAHIDVKGKVMIPVHNGTFDLSLHDWYEPLEKINRLAMENDVKLATPIFGQKLSVKQPMLNTLWWRDMVPTSDLAEQPATATPTANASY